jgi:hypothetical protein
MVSDNRKKHYCWIKDLSRLLGDQHSNTRRYHHCPYCLHGFIKERLLEDHIPYFQTHGPQKIDLPNDDDKWLYYKDIRKQLNVPYVIYADFESLLIPFSNFGISSIFTENEMSLKFRSDILPLYFQTRSPLRRGGYKATMTDHMKHLLSICRAYGHGTRRH